VKVFLFLDEISLIFKFKDLEREALILSRIKHENIVGFFGYSLDPLLIALELCRGF